MGLVARRTACTGHTKGGWMLLKQGDHTAFLAAMKEQPSMGEFHVMKCSHWVPSSRHHVMICRSWKR